MRTIKVALEGNPDQKKTVGIRLYMQRATLKLLIQQYVNTLSEPAKPGERVVVDLVGELIEDSDASGKPSSAPLS